MAPKRNEFTSDLEAFHERLASLSHYQSFVSWQLGQAKEGLKRSLEIVEKQGLKNHYGTGTGMVLFNIFHDGKLPIRAPFGKRITQGEQLLPMADEIEKRFNSFILTSMFEALETYLKACYWKLLYQLRNEIALPEKKAFHKAFPKLAKQERTALYYEKYVAHTCRRNADEAITMFKAQLKWDTVVFKEWLAMPWGDFVAAISFCRHRVVHHEGRVSKESLAKLSKRQRDFVALCLHQSQQDKQESILPASCLLNNVFEGIGSYGWGLYILLTDRCNMVDDSQFFRPEDGAKRRVKPRL